MRAISAFFSPGLPRPVPLRASPRLFLCTHPTPTPATLRDLYTIDQPPDIERAKSAARSSSDNLSSYFRSRPIQSHTRDAFETARHWLRRHSAPRPLCIDSGCGSGRSTELLAHMLPHCDVIGVDKSLARLERTLAYRRYGGVFEGVENALLLRADLVDFWRLCLEERVFPEYHFILYPNPYPKPRHFKRRWHGHAIFPAIAALGGRVELRASWESYLHEFQAAFEVAYKTFTVSSLRRVDHDRLMIGIVRQLQGISQQATSVHKKPLTNFEAKYVHIDKPVFQLCLDTRNYAARSNCSLSGL